MKILTITAALLCAGCATSSGVMPYGKDTYMISKTDNALTASVSALKGSALADAGAYCDKTGQAYEVVGGYDVVRAFGQIPSSEIQFRCIPR